MVNAPYAMSKAAVESFGRSLRAEMAGTGTTAGVLYPGWVSTPIIAASHENPSPPQRTALATSGCRCDLVGQLFSVRPAASSVCASAVEEWVACLTQEALVHGLPVLDRIVGRRAGMSLRALTGAAVVSDALLMGRPRPVSLAFMSTEPKTHRRHPSSERNAITSAANSAWCWNRNPCAASG